jgi:hypothetical protein
VNILVEVCASRKGKYPSVKSGEIFNQEVFICRREPALPVGKVNSKKVPIVFLLNFHNKKVGRLFGKKF